MSPPDAVVPDRMKSGVKYDERKRNMATNASASARCSLRNENIISHCDSQKRAGDNIRKIMPLQ